jgi:hypothetical protein
MNSSTDSENTINQLQQENELLLLQLHQVQEELEHYFLLYQDSQAKSRELPASPVPQALPAAQQPIRHSPKKSQLIVDKLPKNLARILKRTTVVKKSILRHSEFFDEAWYLRTYPDVAKKRRDPVAHYLRHGAKEGRNPGPQFDTQWYLTTYRDVAEKGVNPLLHFIQFGQYEGRQPKLGGIQPPPDPFANERKWLTQARNEQTRLASERQRRIEQLTQVINEAAKRQEKEKQEALSRLAREREEQTRLQAEIQQLAQARDELVWLADERMQQIEELTVAKAEAEKQARLASERMQQIEQLTVAKAEAEKQAGERQNQIEALIQAKDEQARLASERIQQIEELTVAKTDAVKQAVERQNQIEALIQTKDEQARLIHQLTVAKAEAEKQAGERQNQIAALIQAKDEQARLASERIQQIEELTVAKTEAEKQAGERQKQIAALTQAKDEQVKLAEARLQRIKQLETELADTQARQSILNEEMIKAEAQINLIKELLLEEGAV